MSKKTEDQPTTCAETIAQCKFKIGDVVQLNSGGARMTVIGVSQNGSAGLTIVEVACVQIIYEHFSEVCLKLADNEIPF